MTENTNHIHIFKTDIKTNIDKDIIKNALEQITHIEQWTVDNDDKDCVLRIISPNITVKEIIEIINQNGYQCQELE